MTKNMSWFRKLYAARVPSEFIDYENKIIIISYMAEG